MKFSWKTWGPPIAAFVVLLVAVYAWNAEHRALIDTGRALEAAKLRAQGIAAAAEQSEAALRQDLGTLANESAALAAELRRVKEAAHGARPVIVVHGSTGPVVAGGTPVQPCPQSPACPQVPAAPECLLRPGDAGKVVMSGATLETDAGNTVMVAVGEAWRVEPAPSTKLFGGPLKLELSVAAPKPLPRWGAGLGLWAGRWGWAAGPAVALPPARFWGAQMEVTAGVGVGSGGEWSGGATTILRW